MVKSFCLRLLFCFIKDVSTGYLLAENYGQARRELPRSGEKENIVIVARLCFEWCEGGWELGWVNIVITVRFWVAMLLMEDIVISGPRSNHCTV